MFCHVWPRSSPNPGLKQCSATLPGQLSVTFNRPRLRQAGPQRDEGERMIAGVERIIRYCVCYQRLSAGSWLAPNASAKLEDRPPRSRPVDRPAPSCRSTSPDFLQTGRLHERSYLLEMRGCFTPSRDRRVAQEKRRRPCGDPFHVKHPASEGRMER